MGEFPHFEKLLAWGHTLGRVVKTPMHRNLQARRTRGQSSEGPQQWKNKRDYPGKRDPERENPKFCV